MNAIYTSKLVELNKFLDGLEPDSTKNLFETSPYVIHIYEQRDSEKIIFILKIQKDRNNKIQPNNNPVYLIKLETMLPDEKAQYLLGSKNYLRSIRDSILKDFPNAYLLYKTNA